MVLVVVYFSTNKKHVITKYSNENIYDVNSLHIQYLSEKYTKNNLIETFLVDNQELESQ